MDLKLWEYIFEMFNYKTKKIDFFKITNPYPALKALSGVKYATSTRLELQAKILSNTNSIYTDIYNDFCASARQEDLNKIE